MYSVRFVGESDLPAEQAWAVAQVGHCYYCFIKRSAVCPTVLEEAWAAFVRLEQDDDDDVA